MSVSTIAYFGYGSLVNLESLRTPYISAHRAKIKGWKRIWLTRPYEPDSFAASEGLAFLSVTPAPDSEIDGMIITDHATSLAALDKRESLYTRVNIDNTDITLCDDEINTADKFLYVADEHPADKNSQILRSYLDVVMQGYHFHFGLTGLEHFFATTLNFDLDIHEDRKDPLYPRATRLTPEEEKIFARFR